MNSLVESIIKKLNDYSYMEHYIDDNYIIIKTSYFFYYFSNNSINHSCHHYIMISDDERKFINKYLENKFKIRINRVTFGQYRFNKNGKLIE